LISPRMIGPRIGAGPTVTAHLPGGRLVYFT
jgi:hypothetical protein